MGRDPASHKFWDPLLTFMRFDYRANKFAVATPVPEGRACFYGQTWPILGAGGSASPKFLGPPIDAHTL